MPAGARVDELAKTFELRKARPLSLVGPSGRIGIIALEGGGAEIERDHTTLIELATVVLALVDSRRPRSQSIKAEHNGLYTLEYFRDTATREIDKAKRHGRRLAVCAIGLDGDRAARTEFEDVVHQVVRDTDVFAISASNEYLLLLPETGTLGAHACRRRLLLRSEGDRRARTQAVASDRRGPVPSGRGQAFSIGVASYPHDGTNLDRLIRAARHRAQVQLHSSVNDLSLASLSLSEVVDTLVAKPILDSGAGSPYPLDLATSSLVSLAGQACREARRGGEAMVFVSLQAGMGLASAVRQALRDAKDVTVRVVDVRSVAGCADLDAAVVLAEHGSWVCCGRVTKDRFRGVHAADPLLADLIAHRLSQAGGHGS
jgi:GGDEF domain-containing protein